MRLHTVEGVLAPVLLVAFVEQVMRGAARLYHDETQQLNYTRRELQRVFEQRKVGRAWWEVRESHEPHQLSIVLPRVGDALVVLIITAGPAPLTPTDMEDALRVVSRPEFWCRAKLFKALEAARAKGVLREVLDEMDVPTASSNAIEDHLATYWSGQ